ncbi:MAG: hypothetical protein JNL06_00735 [Alphaproteobacteria bacterium]|nr:hypothetical protein [Alphaproteobacteria bacterium]
MRVIRGALLGAIAVFIGIAVVWLEDLFGIPRHIVQWIWLGSILAGLIFAGWAAWDYYRALKDDDHWE